METRRMAKWASFGAVAGILFAACGGQLAETRGRDEVPSSLPITVKDIQAVEEETGVEVRVRTTEKVEYSLFQQTDPLRLVLELPGTSTGDYTANIPVNQGAVSFIRPVPVSRGGSHLEIFLNAPATYAVEDQDDTLLVRISPLRQVEPGELAGTTTAIVEEDEIESRTLPTEEEPVQIAAAVVEEAVESRAQPNLEEPVPDVEPEPAPVQIAAVEENPPVPPAPDAEFVTGLKVDKGDAGTLVTVSGDGDLDYEYFLVEGKSLVVDIYNVTNKIWPTVHKVDDAFLHQIRIGEHFKPQKMVRVVFDLKKLGDYQVSQGDSRIAVAFGSPTVQPAAGEEKAPAGNTVTEVYFKPLENKSRIEIKTESKPEFKIVDSEDPLRLIVEIGNSRIATRAQKTLDLSGLNRAVSKISSFQYRKGDSPVVRVVTQLRQSVPFRVAASADGIGVDVDRVAAAPALAARAPAGEETPPPTAPAFVETEASLEESPAPAPETAKKVYTGKRLSLDFQNADVNDILRLISEVSGLNFVSGPEVKGQVSIKLADVPWDLALDIILKTNIPPLAQIQEADNIVRVTTRQHIIEDEKERRRQEEEKQKTRDAKKKLEPLVTRDFAISYADVEELVAVLQDFTSDRVQKDGLLRADPRTSTIVVRDLAANVEEITRMVEVLDTPTPAVLVEARIVEVSNDFEKSVGIQWGANFVADAAHGNATSFEFPNSVAVGGTQGPGNFLVNLPGNSPVAGIGFSFGHIANTLSLDMRLSAMERLGNVKILSNPKILVVQNEEAMINIGSQLPIPSTDAEGNRTVTFKDVGILLKVRPQVTNDNKVFMEISIEKSSQGETVQTTEGDMFSIDRRGADTQVLISDGETSVIGGIFQQTKANTQSNVPGFSKIPVLGWLFKNRSEQDDRKELMIFITPRVVRAS